MKVGIIGSGGREHAICVSLKKSKKLKKFTVFQEMLVQNKLAENIEIDLIILKN